MEPFVLVLLAGGGAHGYAITAQLEEMGIAGGPVDVGQVYRTLRDLEEAGQVTSSWSTEPVGPQRRDYELTESGYAAIDAWAAVMKEQSQAHRRVQTRGISSRWPPRARDADRSGQSGQSGQSGSALAWSMPRASRSFSAADRLWSRTAR